MGEGGSLNGPGSAFVGMAGVAGDGPWWMGAKHFPVLVFFSSVEGDAGFAVFGGEDEFVGAFRDLDFGEDYAGCGGDCWDGFAVKGERSFACASANDAQRAGGYDAFVRGSEERCAIPCLEDAEVEQ